MTSLVPARVQLPFSTIESWLWDSGHCGRTSARFRKMYTCGSAKPRLNGGNSPSNAEAAFRSLSAPASTMLRTMKRPIALSFGGLHMQWEQSTRWVCPRPCLLRPLFLLFLGILAVPPGTSKTANQRGEIGDSTAGGASEQYREMPPCGR